MENIENLIPAHVTDRIADMLNNDGFWKPIPGLFVKKLDSDWRAWMAVSGSSFYLWPVLGVFSDELIQIADTARARIGRPSKQPPESGPPLIMAHLIQIINDDPECQKHMSWHFEVEDRHIADPALIPELKTEAADDLVYCLRRKAYPFFAAHMTYQSIWDAIRTREALPSPAIRNYFPIILMKLGRRADVPRFVEEQVKQISNARIAANYREYVDALLAVVPA